MLAVVLAAIGLGGLAAAAWLRWRPEAGAHLPVVAMLTGCAVIGSYAAFERLTEGTQIEAWHRIVWLASVLTLLPSMLSGVLFTLLGDALQRHVGAATRTTGWLTLWNTGGAMCGPLAAAFVLLPFDRDGGRVLRSRRRLRPRRDPRRAGGRNLAYAPARAGLRRLHVRSGGSSGVVPVRPDARRPLRAGRPTLFHGRFGNRRRQGRTVRDDSPDAATLAGAAGLQPARDQRVLDVRDRGLGSALHALLRLLAHVRAPRPHRARTGHLLRRRRDRGRGAGRARRRVGRRRGDLARHRRDERSHPSGRPPAARPPGDPARRRRAPVPPANVGPLRRDHRRATAAAHARGGQHLYARVLPAHSRPSRRGRRGNLLAARRPPRSGHQRERDHPGVLRRVRRLLAVERHAVRPHARRNARRERPRLRAGVRATLAPAGAAGSPGRGRPGTAAADRGDVPRRRPLSERADRERPGSGRQPSPPPATRSPRPVVVGPGIRQRPGGHRALRQRSGPGASARRVDGVRLRAPPVARGADRGGPPVFRPPAGPEPGHVGRRPAIGADRRPPLAADRDAPAHAAALAPGHRPYDGPHRATGWRRNGRGGLRARAGRTRPPRLPGGGGGPRVRRARGAARRCDPAVARLCALPVRTDRRGRGPGAGSDRAHGRGTPLLGVDRSAVRRRPAGQGADDVLSSGRTRPPQRPVPGEPTAASSLASSGRSGWTARASASHARASSRRPRRTSASARPNHASANPGSISVTRR